MGSLPSGNASLVNTIRTEIASALASLTNISSQPLASNNDFTTALPAQQFLPTSSGSVDQALPAIPAVVLERIRRGEFINFDLLLPNNVPSETSNSFTVSLDYNDQGAAPCVMVRDNPRSNKNKVVDLYSWLLAWSLFFPS